jgi:hypothetical protein
MTIDRLFRVNGTSAQQVGVVPDIILPDFSEIQSEREKSLPFSLQNTSIDANKYYHPYPPIAVEPLKTFSKTFIDTSQLFNSFNKYLDALSQAQTSRDQDLVFNKMMEDRNQMTQSLNDEEKLMAHAKPPYEIEWNQYEKLRMRADPDLLRTNNTLARMLSRDAGILMGYELASRMAVK